MLVGTDSQHRPYNSATLSLRHAGLVHAKMPAGWCCSWQQCNRQCHPYGADNLAHKCNPSDERCTASPLTCPPPLLAASEAEACAMP